MSKKSTLTVEKLNYCKSSLAIVESLRDLDNLVFLDSCQPHTKLGRFDIVCAAPHTLISCDHHQTVVRNTSTNWESQQDPFEIIKQLLRAEQHETPKELMDLPFTGGAVGFFSYDLGRRLESVPALADADLNIPYISLGIYPWTIIQDHKKCQTWLLGMPSCSKSVLNEIKQRFQDKPAAESEQQSEQQLEMNFKLKSPFRSNIDRLEYQSKFQTISNYIQSGDCYQINFAQRFSAEFVGSPWSAYKLLRDQAAAPYSAFLDLGSYQVLSFSPERFLNLQNGRVETKPIKGTRARQTTPEADNKAIDALKASTKDHAENLMIVDLLRNDLSKNCQLGSVQVDKLFEVESFANVHHLVSTVHGQLEANKTALDLIRDCFPGGSITGAPKIRAMEIIEELEPQRRSIYCGSIGFISANGNMDTNIAIRTLLCKDHQIHCWGGGGIIADSDVEEELQESIDKVKQILACLETTLSNRHEV